MRRILANEKGLTLVEILAVIVIAAIIMLLISSVLVGVQNKYKEQSREAAATFDVTYAAKVITKDFRKAESIILESGDITMEMAEAEDVVYRFDQQEQILYKNRSLLVRGITMFAMKEQEKNMYMITIKSESGQTIKTELTQRN